MIAAVVPPNPPPTTATRSLLLAVTTSPHHPHFFRNDVAVLHDRHAVEEQRAVAQRDVEMAGRIVAAAELRVRAGREQHVAVERAAVLARRLRRERARPHEAPARIGVEAPADMRYGKCARIVEALHEVAHQGAVEAATLDVDDIAGLYPQRDRRGHVAHERQQDVAGIDDDRAVDAIVVGGGVEERARPGIPPPGPVGEAVLLRDVILAHAIGHVGPCRRGDAKRLGLGQHLGAGLDALPCVRTREHPLQHVERLDHQQHAGSGLGDLGLLRGPQQPHQVDDEIGTLEGFDRGGVAAQGIAGAERAAWPLLDVDVQPFGTELVGGREERFSVVEPDPILGQNADGLVRQDLAELELLLEQGNHIAIGSHDPPFLCPPRDPPFRCRPLPHANARSSCQFCAAASV